MEELPKGLCTDCIRKIYDIQDFIGIANLSNECLNNILMNPGSGFEVQSFIQLPNVEVDPGSEIQDTNDDNSNDSNKSNDDNNADSIKDGCGIEVEEDQLHTDQETTTNYCCNSCNEVFLSLEDLTVHRKQNENCAVECKLCHATFESYALMVAHKQKHTSSEVKKYQCHSCGERFETKSNLASHKALHAAQASHGCKFCGKHFKRPSTLRRHVNYVHKKLRPFKCQICGKGKSFRSSKFLKYSKLVKNVTFELKNEKVHKQMSPKSFNGTLSFENDQVVV